MTCCDCGKEIGPKEAVVAAFFRWEATGELGLWRAREFTGEVWHRRCDSSVGRVKEWE